MTTAAKKGKSTTTSETWRCPLCHRPLGYMVRYGKRCALVVVDPATLAPLAEIRDGTVYCPCGGARIWYPNGAEKLHKTAT